MSTAEAGPPPPADAPTRAARVLTEVLAPAVLTFGLLR
jgi:hypothetical protein